MRVFHMSDTLQLGSSLIADYKEQWDLVRPFVQALERSEDCLYAAMYAAKYQYEVLYRFSLADMQTDYVKWVTEAVFEVIRRRESPQACSRMKGTYYFTRVEDCQELMDKDWAMASQEERAKIRLFEVELEAPAVTPLDMRWFDEAYNWLEAADNIGNLYEMARRYFAGAQTEHPVWEILSDAKATAVADRTELLRP